MFEKGLGVNVAKQVDEYNEKNGVFFHGWGNWVGGLKNALNVCNMMKMLNVINQILMKILHRTIY